MPLLSKIGPGTVRQTFLTCFWLNAGDWKLVPGPFVILLKWQFNSGHLYFLVDPYSPFQNMKHWNFEITGY